MKLDFGSFLRICWAMCRLSQDYHRQTLQRQTYETRASSIFSVAQNRLMIHSSCWQMSRGIVAQLPPRHGCNSFGGRFIYQGKIYTLQTGNQVICSILQVTKRFVSVTRKVFFFQANSAVLVFPTDRGRVFVMGGRSVEDEILDSVEVSCGKWTVFWRRFLFISEAKRWVPPIVAGFIRNDAFQAGFLSAGEPFQLT